MTLREEWTQYISNIATLSGLLMEENGVVYPDWVKDDMYLIPGEWVWDKVTMERRSHDKVVDLAREQGKLDERFKWDDDPRNPLRAVAAVFAKYLEADRKKREEAIKLLVGR